MLFSIHSLHLKSKQDAYPGVCVLFAACYLRKGNIFGDLRDLHPDIFDPFFAQFPGSKCNDTGIHIQLGKNPGPAVLDLFAQMGEEISPVGIDQRFVASGPPMDHLLCMCLGIFCAGWNVQAAQPVFPCADIAPEHTVFRNIQLQKYRRLLIDQKAVFGRRQKDGIGIVFGNGCKFAGDPGIPSVHPVAVFCCNTIPCVQLLFTEAIGACFHQLAQRFGGQASPQCVGPHRIILSGRLGIEVGLLGQL